MQSSVVLLSSVPAAGWALGVSATRAVLPVLSLNHPRIATHFSFLREIPMFSRYELRVSVMSWDQKWVRPPHFIHTGGSLIPHAPMVVISYRVSFSSSDIACTCPEDRDYVTVLTATFFLMSLPFIPVAVFWTLLTPTPYSISWRPPSHSRPSCF